MIEADVRLLGESRFSLSCCRLLKIEFGPSESTSSSSSSSILMKESEDSTEASRLLCDISTLGQATARSMCVAEGVETHLKCWKPSILSSSMLSVIIEGMLVTLEVITSAYIFDMWSCMCDIGRNCATFANRIKRVC